jgi:hypothetical protein
VPPKVIFSPTSARNVEFLQLFDPKVTPQVTVFRHGVVNKVFVENTSA